MNMQPPAASEPGLDAQSAAPDVLHETRPVYWSIRRELWENRSLWIVPLTVAAFALFGFMIGSIGLPKKIRIAATLAPLPRHLMVVDHFSMAPVPIVLVAILVGVFYSVDALYGERRDRSILFWKSLPVSDLTTVLTKASIPLAVLPLIAFVVSTVLQCVMLLWSTVVLLASGVNPFIVWSEFHFLQEPLILLYGLIVLALWQAPLHAWFLLVSSWARRTPFLWAVLPLVIISVLEKSVFGTGGFAAMTLGRLTGSYEYAFVQRQRPGKIPLIDDLTELTPLRFIGSPGLWVGLIVAAAFLFAATRMRRNREPI
jgi:ABC-2 type transport system permease protein